VIPLLTTNAHDFLLAVDHAERGSTDVNDAILEFPVEDHGRINRNKPGWIMKKMAARVVDGYAF